MHLRMNFHQQTQQKYRPAIPILESCIHAAGGGGGAHPGLPPPSHEKNTTFLSSDVSHFLRWCLNKICSSLWRYLENQSSDGGQLDEICMKVKVVINYSDMKVEKKHEIQADMKVQKRNMKVEKRNMKVEKRNLKVEKRNMKVESRKSNNLKRSSNDVKNVFSATLFSYSLIKDLFQRYIFFLKLFYLFFQNL